MKILIFFMMKILILSIKILIFSKQSLKMIFYNFLNDS